MAIRSRSKNDEDNRFNDTTGMEDIDGGALSSCFIFRRYTFSKVWVKIISYPLQGNRSRQSIPLSVWKEQSHLRLWYSNVFYSCDSRVIRMQIAHAAQWLYQDRI